MPRILLSPVYLTTEYVIRRPLGYVVSAADRAHVPHALYDFFLFGKDHRAGIVPTVLFDFGFEPSVGLYGFWDDAGYKGHDLMGHFSVWTSNWVAGSIGERFRFSPRDSLTLKVAGLRRPDRTFFGLGPNSLQGSISRYGENRIETTATFDVHPWRSSELQAGPGFRTDSFFNGYYDDDPGILQASGAGEYPLPYGFQQGYTEGFSHAILALDTRRHQENSGVRLEFQGELGGDVKSAPYSGWVRYEGAAGAFLDLTGRGRVLSLVVTTVFADPLRSGTPIPFTELVSPGGSSPILSTVATGTGLLPGFYLGRLLDRSAAVATIEYRWPVWALLDGTLQVATGNVFGEHLEDFRPGLLRISAAIGFGTHGVSDNPISALIGFGSETFDGGCKIDTIRIAFSTTHF